MTTTVRAVYQNGVLRPAEPLDLPDGSAVDLTLTTPGTAADHATTVPDPPPSPAEEEVLRRIRNAKTLQEWIDAANSAPDPNDGYDLIEALEENRRREGRAPLFPNGPGGTP